MEQKKEGKGVPSGSNEGGDFSSVIKKMEEGKRLLSEANTEIESRISNKKISIDPTVNKYEQVFEYRKKLSERDYDLSQLSLQLNSAIIEINKKDRLMMELGAENEGLRMEIGRLNAVSKEILDERGLLVEKINELSSYTSNLHSVLEKKEAELKKRFVQIKDDYEERVNRILKEQTSREIELKVRIEQLSSALAEQKTLLNEREKREMQLMSDLINRLQSLFPGTLMVGPQDNLGNLEKQVSKSPSMAPQKGDRFSATREGIINLDFNIKNPFQYNLSDGEEQSEISPMVDIALAQGDSFDSIKYSLLLSGYRKSNIEKVLKERI